MGLLDGIVGNVLGSALGGNQGRQGASNPLGSILNGLSAGEQSQGGGTLLAAAMMLIQQSGGLSNVLEMLRSSGMEKHASSWVGTGPNMGISPDQVQQVFGNDALSNVASQLGMSHGQTSAAMAQILPELVNQLTPTGKLPDNHGDLISQALSMLRAGGV